MLRKSILQRIFITFAVAVLMTTAAFAQTTAFNYQGKLNDNGNPSNGTVQMEFKLFDALAGGNQIGATLSDVSVIAANGVFSTSLDFGASIFTGNDLFLEIAVRRNAGENYTTLTPRERVASSPYAIRSLSAAQADVALDSNKLGGLDASEYVTTATVGSDFINNSTTEQTADFNISGNGTLGGTLSVNSLNSATQYSIGGNPVLKLGGTDNIFVGVGAGGNTTSNGNAFFGTSAGFNNTTGEANAFFGRSSGFQNTTGSSNSFFGTQAGRDNSTGTQNSFFGRQAGIGNSTGVDNSFFGAFAGQANAGGNNNSFFGVSAGYNNVSEGNAFFGRSAGFQNTAGYSNSFFGTQAGRDNTTGNDNTFFGRVAGINNYTGSNNTIIGSNANVGAGNLFNATAIGANAVVSQNNSLVLGFNANVGIGTSTPTVKLEVIGNTLFTTGGSGGKVQFGTPSGESGMSIFGTNRADIRFDGTTLKLLAGTGAGAMSSTNGINIKLDGNVGIGTTNPTEKLEVVGTMKTSILQITGGSDLAEKFEFTETVKPGMVVAIDLLQPGKLSISRTAYNRRVAGVISGANNLAAGMILPNLNDAENSMPVALSGRVWVYCDATQQPINTGDLLTTSATAGHAMKVTNFSKAQGAIIGKALTALKSGKGLVLVLVTLQ